MTSHVFFQIKAKPRKNPLKKLQKTRESPAGSRTASAISPETKTKPHNPRGKRQKNPQRHTRSGLSRKEAIRTPDPYVPNVVRYQLRYFPKAVQRYSFFWKYELY